MKGEAGGRGKGEGGRNTVEPCLMDTPEKWTPMI